LTNKENFVRSILTFVDILSNLFEFVLNMYEKSNFISMTQDKLFCPYQSYSIFLFFSSLYIYMGRSMETHPLFWKSIFLEDFFSVSGGWAMKNRCEIVFGSKTY